MNLLRKIAKALGFTKNTPYVKRSLTMANIRSAIFMSAVIIILEVMFIVENVVTHPTSTWEQNWYYQMNFWVLLLNGFAVIMFACYVHYGSRTKTNFLTWAAFISSLVSITYCLVTCFRFWSIIYSAEYPLINVFYFLLFALSILTSVFMIIGLLTKYFKNTIPYWTISAVVILFSLTCLAFGMKTTYSDRLKISWTKPRYTEMVPFLTMMLYVGCLLTWRPIISIPVNVTIGVSYYYVMVSAGNFSDANGYNYLTYFISLSMVSIVSYILRYRQAEKEEQLEYWANYDELTGTHSYGYFLAASKQYLVDKKPADNEMVYLFINVSNFKNYNDQRDFVKGNECLKEIGRLVAKHFGYDLSCRVSDDHFAAFTRTTNIEKRIEGFNADVKLIDKDIELATNVGIYKVKDLSEDPRRSVDKARYACSLLSRDLSKFVLEYDDKMDEGFHLMQYVIRNVDKACKEGWVRPFYQPVVWSKDEKLCGVEALARWIDPVKGFLSPASFVPTLESTKLIYKLDACILESVCRDIRRSLDAGKPVVPVSINFSRLDFELMDAVNILEGFVKKYKVPKSYLHVEITESALVDDMGILTKAVNELKARGYALWLDDFGSGYSSLNVLKDYDFDVLKIDMKFLSGFEHNPKAKPLIESVIDMAEKIGMKTLTEGVETNIEKEFLHAAGCGRLQGYLFGKPLSYEDLYLRIQNKELIVSKDNLVD